MERRRVQKELDDANSTTADLKLTVEILRSSLSASGKKFDELKDQFELYRSLHNPKLVAVLQEQLAQAKDELFDYQKQVECAKTEQKKSLEEVDQLTREIEQYRATEPDSIRLRIDDHCEGLLSLLEPCLVRGYKQWYTVAVPYLRQTSVTFRQKLASKIEDMPTTVSHRQILQTDYTKRLSHHPIATTSLLTGSFDDLKPMASSRLETQ